MLNSVSGDDASFIANADKKSQGHMIRTVGGLVKICCMIDDAHYMHTLSRSKVNQHPERTETNKMVSRV